MQLDFLPTATQLSRYEKHQTDRSVTGLSQLYPYR